MNKNLLDSSYKIIIVYYFFGSFYNRRSECSVLSCASSTIITEYFFNKGSNMHSRSSIPSVKNFIFVLIGSNFSSNLML